MKRNQAFIVTYFSKTREKFCDHLLGEGEKKRDERKELLIKVLQLIQIQSLVLWESQGRNQIFIQYSTIVVL